MLRYIFTLFILNIFLAFQICIAEPFSERQSIYITDFPGVDDEAEWQALLANLPASPDPTLSSEQSFLGAIVALRTGSNELAKAYTDHAQSAATTDNDITRAELLLAFNAFYMGAEHNRRAAADNLLEAASAYNAAAIEIDWLMGTSATLLLDYGQTQGAPDLSKQVIEMLTDAMTDDLNFLREVWLVNAHLKAAYAASFFPENEIDPFGFLVDANQLIDNAERASDSEEEKAALEFLYLRVATIYGVMVSRRQSENKAVPKHHLRFVSAFHPAFQTRCVANLGSSKKRFTSRRKYGTGGLMVQLQVDARGRVKFDKTLDAQPTRLKENFMHSYLRKWAASMRVDLNQDDPTCVNGGKIWLPLILSWE